jgi:hypothetical protein
VANRLTMKCSEQAKPQSGRNSALYADRVRIRAGKWTSAWIETMVLNRGAWNGVVERAMTTASSPGLIMATEEDGATRSSKDTPVGL